MPKFQVGDVVFLKSGGAARTVTKIEKDQITVGWFDPMGNVRNMLCSQDDLVHISDNVAEAFRILGPGYVISKISSVSQAEVIVSLLEQARKR